MLDPRWLIRASQWTRNRPSWQRVKLVLVVLAICLALAGLQWAGLWPEALTVNGRPKLP